VEKPDASILYLAFDDSTLDDITVENESGIAQTPSAFIGGHFIFHETRMFLFAHILRNRSGQHDRPA
jgi:hypothetical protein